MQPKKSKILLTTTADKTGIPLDIVSLVVNEFYKEIRSSLSSLKAPVVQVPGLGNFGIKPWAVDKAINRYQNFENRTRLKGNLRQQAITEADVKMRQLVAVKELLALEQQRKQFIKHHRNNL